MKRKLLGCILILTVLCGCTDTLADPARKQSTYSSMPPETEATEMTEATEDPSAESVMAGAQNPQPAESEPAESVVPPEVGANLAVAQTAVTVDGTALAACYTAEGENTLLLRVRELADVCGATYTPEADRCRLETETWRVELSDASASVDGQPLEMAGVYDGEDWYAPVQILGQLGYTELQDPEQNHFYYTRMPDVTQIPAGITVPVLMYHAVSDNIWGTEELFVSPGELDKQLQYLTDNGYTPIWFEDLPDVAQIEKPVILTFDDGYDDNYTELFPLLQKYQVKATIFVIAGDLAQHHKMTAEQVAELSQSGLVSIQSHTMTHKYLVDFDEEELEYELGQSQLELTRITGKQPCVLCYPNGAYSQQTLDQMTKYYRFGILMNGDTYVTGVNDPLLIPRFYVSRYTDLDGFINLLS